MGRSEAEGWEILDINKQGHRVLINFSSSSSSTSTPYPSTSSSPLFFPEISSSSSSSLCFVSLFWIVSSASSSSYCCFVSDFALPVAPCPSMAASSSFSMLSLVFLYVTALSSLHLASSASAPPCPHESVLFLNSLLHRCPLSISPIPPVEVDADFLDRVLLSKKINGYTSVLFYASWCPFSRMVRSPFEILSSMFPQIEHLAIEQSSAMPSVYSRYGIHSLPSVLIVNQTSRVRYHGPKNLNSLVQFYEKTTGLEPVQFIEEVESNDSVDEKCIIRTWNQSCSPKEILTREPYLVLSIVFLCLRMLLSIFPEVVSHLSAFWVAYAPHFNMEIFGETSQIFGRALHMVDVRRIWTKLRLCKTRYFHERALSARVWASSLASVSLGESSSARS